MKAFTTLEGIAALLDKANVDTDQIIPKQFLRKIERSGFGVHLFHDWRYTDNEGKNPNKEFSLNQERYKGASNTKHCVCDKHVLSQIKRRVYVCVLSTIEILRLLWA